MTSLGWESLLSQSRFQESICLKCSERLVRSLRRRMLQLRLPMAASRTPGEMIKQALPGISANAWQGSEVTTEADDQLGTKRQFRYGSSGSVEFLATDTNEIHDLQLRVESTCLTDCRRAAIIEVSRAHNICAEQGFPTDRRPVELPTVCLH